MPSNRNRAWADERFIGQNLVAGASGHQRNLLFNAPTMDTLTAVRIVGDITVQVLPTVTFVDSLSIIDVGIGVSSQEAFDVPALPSPAVDTEYPPRGWLYVASLPVSERLQDTTVMQEVARFQFDIRAMRKIDKGVLFIRVINTNIIVGAAMVITGRVRVLCLT